MPLQIFQGVRQSAHTIATNSRLVEEQKGW